MNRPPRVLLIGKFTGPSGFARVLRTVADALAAHGVGVHALATDEHAGSEHGSRPVAPVSAVPAASVTVHQIIDRHDVYGVHTIPALMREVRPDAVLLVHDAWLIPHYAAAIRRSRPESRILAYVPLDGQLIEPDACVGLDCVDRVVAYNAFGRRAFADAADKLGRPPASPLRDAAVIPHIIDTTAFRPLAGERSAARRTARRRLFGGSTRQDSFLVLNANTNTYRKRLDITLRGFAAFARDKPPGVLLYLHTAVHGDFDLAAIASSLHIRDRLLFTDAAARHPAVPDKRLNEIYGACDVGVDTALGEGWGLVSFEHAATGAAQVVPAYGATGELWAGAAELLPPGRIVAATPFHEGGEIDPETLAAALDRLYRDPERLRKAGDGAARLARSRAFQAATVARQWIALLGPGSA